MTAGINMNQVGQVYKASTHLQTCKRIDGRTVINQLIAQLSCLKYVSAVVRIYKKCVVLLCNSLEMHEASCSFRCRCQSRVLIYWVASLSRLLSLLGVMSLRLACFWYYYNKCDCFVQYVAQEWIDSGKKLQASNNATSSRAVADLPISAVCC